MFIYFGCHTSFISLWVLLWQMYLTIQLYCVGWLLSDPHLFIKGHLCRFYSLYHNKQDDICLWGLESCLFCWIAAFIYRRQRASIQSVGLTLDTLTWGKEKLGNRTTNCVISGWPFPPHLPGSLLTHLLVTGFWVQTPLHGFHPQLLLGRVHVEESFSAQVQFLKTRVINQVTILDVIEESGSRRQYLWADSQKYTVW